MDHCETDCQSFTPSMLSVVFLGWGPDAGAGERQLPGGSLSSPARAFREFRLGALCSQ
jgi:hypothetical protein